MITAARILSLIAAGTLAVGIAGGSLAVLRAEDPDPRPTIVVEHGIPDPSSPDQQQDVPPCTQASDGEVCRLKRSVD